jgi:predicted N-acetyltransferase YhbS
MDTKVRHYGYAADHERVGRFLVRTCGRTGGHINWLLPRWEYMHHHPLIRGVDLRSIGIWEARGEIVGIVHPEHQPGTAYFQIDPEHGALKGEMLEFAAAHSSTAADGTRRLRILITDRDEDFAKVAAAQGFARTAECETTSHMRIPESSPRSSLPAGFRLKSLADDNDLRRVTRVLWRGFDHGDEPPDDAIEDRRLMQSAPSYRKDLNLVVVGPDGSFVSYAGIWYEPVHAIAYVEPVATDPDYRRMGLASAAVLEGIRRCGELGASVAYVGSGQPLYRSLGFRPEHDAWVWERRWT